MFQSVGSPSLWIGFALLVLTVLFIDLKGFHKRAHAVRFREALTWVVVWVSLALAFNIFIYFRFGTEKALEFLTGYMIEEALSVDNLFVFLVIFSYFPVPKLYQHRVLFWGILGAMVMRMLFILLGTALIQSFHWVIFIFGAFLVYTGIKILLSKSEEVHPEKNPAVRLFRRFVPLVTDYEGASFMVKKDKRWLATPLLLVLVVVEASDVVFAVDSIPAIFAVTRDPFIVYTSNIFAILGLRSLFFLLSGMMEKFQYLKVGLGLVLVFI